MSMPAGSGDFSLEVQKAEFERDLAETAKLRRESEKFIAEQRKLIAEDLKLRNDVKISPWVIAAAFSSVVSSLFGGVVVAVIAHFWR